jgi:predicted HTH transcriptional regulator
MDVVNPRWLLNKRQADILSLAKEVGYIRVEDLANRFKVTSQTIRRDMNILCNERFLSRTHGGAYYTSKEDFDEDLQDKDNNESIFSFTKTSLIFNDQSISIKAIGLYSYMSYHTQIHKSGKFTIRSLAKRLRDGEDSIRTGLKELRQAGWIVYIKHSDGSGEYLLRHSDQANIEKTKKG